MTWPTEEILMAYADGALSVDERRKVDAHLATSPEDRALVEQFRRADDLARASMDDLDLHPDARLAALIRSAPVPERPDEDRLSQDAAKVVPFLRPTRRTMSVPRYALPLAACLALMIGFGTGFLSGRDRSTGLDFAIGPVAPRTSLASVLDNAPSGAPAQRDLTLQVTSTFFDRNTRQCREFERLDASKKPIAAAIACRSPGGWVIEGAARVATAPSSSNTKPAGTADHDALTGVLEAIGAKPALSRSQEQQLIDKQWR